MNSHTSNLTANQHLPDWSERLFVVLDPSHRWAPAIRLQMNELLSRQSSAYGQILFDTCDNPRDIVDYCDTPNIAGVILFVDGKEREVLGLLRTLWQTSPAVQVLVVCEERHRELIPVMLESGVATCLTNVKNDVPVAEWCFRLLARDFAEPISRTLCSDERTSD